MMSFELLLALAAFALVTSVTPGPNNIMLLTSGVNFGFRRTIPHAFGVTIGFTLMILIVGLGVGQILTADPRVFLALKVISILYMLWLAWKIAHSGPVDGSDGANSGVPMTFLQAAAFQWVNPKAWAIALVGTANYTIAGNYMWSLVVICLAFLAINLPSISLWVGSGVAMRRLLQDPVKVRVFNWAMAAVLVGSMVPSAIEAATGLQRLVTG